MKVQTQSLAICWNFEITFYFYHYILVFLIIIQIFINKNSSSISSSKAIITFIQLKYNSIPLYKDFSTILSACP